MRKLFILLFFISILSYSLKAQKIESLHFGLHYFNIEDDKFSVDFINIGYQRNFKKNWLWDTSLGYISYSRENLESYNAYFITSLDNPTFNAFNQTSIIALNSRIGYILSRQKKSNFGLAVGVTTVYKVEDYFATSVSFYNPNTNRSTYSSYTTYHKAFDIGWTPKLFLERKINDSFSLEGAAEIYFHLRNEVSYIYALGLRVNYTLGKEAKSNKQIKQP
jgi:hypothetical protein